MGSVTPFVRAVRDVSSLGLLRRIGGRTTGRSHVVHILLRVRVTRRRTGRNFDPSRYHRLLCGLLPRTLPCVQVYKLVKVTAGASSASLVGGRFRGVRRLFARLGGSMFGNSRCFYRLSVKVDRSCPVTVHRNDAVVHVKADVFKRQRC